MESREKTFVVGIGASAGGMEAIFDFFSGMKEKTGAAFVIVRHLKRDQKSEFPELLKKYTSLNIHVVKGGETPNPENIYIVPEKNKVIIQHGKFHLIERPEDEIISTTIDTFLHSLANDFKEKAIGIILSGYMEDGVKGAKEIAEKGGMVIVQEPTTAYAKEMPAKTIHLLQPAYILPPQEMAKQISKFIRSKISMANG